MTDKQPEALRLADTLDLAPENGIEPQTSEDAAAELRRLHTENTALQQGYAAARLEIESLKSQLSAEPLAPRGAPQLPERDASVPGERQGLFRKFDVRRVDGSDQPGGKHHGCRYFVLDVDHDPRAHAALTAYAAACESSHPKLAADLRSKWGAAPTTQPVPQREPAEIDTATMALAESVGLIGPASRTHDLHGAIQRFHDLICANATIKAAQMAAEAISAAAPQPSPAAQGDALSDDAVRVPLDSLHADAAYLIGRLREGSMSYARVIEIIRERIDAAKAAIRARAAQEPVAWYVTGCGRLLDEDEAKAEARHIGGTARAMPLYTAPPPVEREPLTDEAVDLLCKVGFVYVLDGKVTRTPAQYRDELKAAQRYGLRQGERAHGIGIKGGQHGAE